MPRISDPRRARHAVLRPVSADGYVDKTMFVPIVVLAAIVVLLVVLWPRGLEAPRPVAPPPDDQPAQGEAESAPDADTSAAAPPKDQTGSPPASVATTSPTSKESDVQELPIVEFKTTLGDFRARLFTDKAPKTAQNFLDLVDKKFYDGIIFHRVIKDFMVQTGDPTGTGTGGRTAKGLPAKKLADEFHRDLKHDRPGLLSMANAGPNTGDTQFFITCAPTPWLDNKHAIFGEVIEGMDVVRKIESVQTGRQDRPLDPPKILSIRRAEAAK